MKKRSKILYLVGIDEAGRGPIAGPVAVGIVKISKKVSKSDFDTLGIVKGKGFKDSKQLSEVRRGEIFEKMKKMKKSRKIDFAVSMVSAGVIDKEGISRAIVRAITRNIKKLNLNSRNTFIYLDGRLHAPDEFDQETIIKGDTKKLEIALASIAAKVTRDRYMIRQSKKYPEYGFEKHKGYGTKGHYKAIRKAGECKIHRKSYLTSA